MSERVGSREAATDPIVAELLDAVADPAVVCDPDGTVRAWNEPFAERIDDDPRDSALAAVVDCPSDPLKRAVETGERTIGSGPLAASGREVTVAVRPVERDGAVTAAVVTLSDATDPFETERALYEASVDAAADAVYVVDRSHTIRAASDGFERFTGIPSERVEGHDIDCLRELGIIDGETFHEGMRALRDLFAGEVGSHTITSNVRLDEAMGYVENRLAPIERDGEVVAVVNVVRDVTERERRREALAANRERLSTIMEDLPVMMVVVDAAGRIDHCQGLDFDALVCDRSEFLGEPVDAFEPVCPDLVTGFYRALDGETTDATATINDRTYKACFEPLSEAEPGGGGADDAVAAGAIAVAIDITDRTQREAQLQARERELRAVIESSADPIAMQDVDGRYQVVNEAMVEIIDGDRDSIVGSTPGAVFDDRFATRLESHRRAVLDTEGARVVEETVAAEPTEKTIQLTFAPYNGPDGEVQGTVSIARDITELERQRGELETLAEIQELVQESVRALTGATTSEAIKESVCERLADSEYYQFAWIGQREASKREVAPTHWAGIADDYLDEITVTVAADDRGGGPAGEAYRTGEVQVVHDVTSEPAFEPWCEAAVESGFGSMVAVPLTHGSTTHGLLAVYADRPNAFSKRELSGFETLGEAVGFGLAAAQYRRLLESDSVLELEFEVNEETPLFAASREHGCRFEIDHAVRVGDDRVVNYLTVDGADPEVGAAAARELSHVEEIRELDREDGPHFEMTLTDSVFRYLADAGARGKRGIVEDGVGHMIVEAPADLDVRRVTEAMNARFSDVSLAAKRERHRTDTPWWLGHGDIGARLTDRQRAVLKTAYYNGYYEWPRDADSETLADSLDIASTTFLQHLRKGHCRVLEAMFDS
ncbi:putative PAS/PAC sensor protein [Halosimplex carlsbadense 2-9-1]|uniref:Putative PAS/PAC sensor protein n=1 Tax=Halosimplex carlsbadense 2-9-1 TaxID=797114 RepID=M0CA98_9EURY|nr:bacterio-opsin activator domain-containing protein [Halosimplex carlsbadense]ELZ20221.1 putative PAS/PAC sensor protein [Halosimplex carlsbadense 2-9-1]